MMPERPPDPELEASTLRWMKVGTVLMALFILAFPVYRLYEPAGRAEARESQRQSLITQGSELWAQNCASCHGANGEGVDAPALNSKQFLTAVVDEQVESIIAHGIPGTEMPAWSLDFGGPLTSEQIRAITTFMRSWEKEAPDRPDWRTPEPPPGAEHGHDEGEPADAHGAEEPADAHGEEASAGGGGEPTGAVAQVERALAMIEDDPSMAGEALELVEGVLQLSAEELMGLDVEALEQAREALAAGDLHEAEDALMAALGEAPH